MEWLNNVIGLVIGVFTLLGILIGVISVVIKLRKGKPTPVTENLDTLKSVIDHSLDMVRLIPELVVKAEEIYGRGNGVNKLDYVMTKLQLYALQNKADYNEEDLKEYVEKIITTTKSVNVVKGE